MAERWKMTVVLVLSLLLTGLACLGSLRAQIKEGEVDFEVLATVTMKKGDNLWDLATKYYGDPLKWPLIKDLNKIPNEKKIPVGAVIYIPVKEAKRIVEGVEAEIAERKAIEEELSKEIAKLKEDLSAVKAKSEECEEKNKELAEALKEKDASIADLEGMLDNVKAGLDKMKAEAELEAQAQEMRAAAQAAAEKKREELAAALEAKDKKIQELEEKFKQCQRDVAALESMRDELRVKIAEAERRRPPSAVSADHRSRVAAVAIAIVGSIIWIASN
jgi:uncharacterized protein YoxC